MKKLYYYCAYTIIFCITFTGLNAELYASGGSPLNSHSTASRITAAQETDDYTVSRVITAVDDGSEFKVVTGEVIRVELEFRAGTGYLWHPEISDTTVLALKSGGNEVLSGKEITGGPVLGVWYFEALAPGASEIGMLYYRDWEGPEKFEKEFGVRINVVEKR